MLRYLNMLPRANGWIGLTSRRPGRATIDEPVRAGTVTGIYLPAAGDNLATSELQGNGCHEAFPHSPCSSWNVGMSERSRKRRGPLLWLGGRSRRFWIVMAVILPVIYVGSFGPACWWTTLSPTGPPRPSEALLFYWPFGCVFNADCPIIREGMKWWMTLGAPPGRNIYLPTDPAGEHWVVTGTDW